MPNPTGINLHAVEQLTELIPEGLQRDANIACSMSTTMLEKSSQHIRDFKLAIEFKYLMKHAPAGVYLMPEFENIRNLHGVIFVRRGLYRDGVFRFTMTLPQLYNDEGTHPIIQFTPPIFNPLVDANTGILDLTVDESLREWQPDKHFIVTAVTFLKKIFYMKDYESISRFANPDAKALFDEDKNEYLFRITACVRESLNRIYDIQNPECTLVFTEPKPAHDDVIKRILYQHAQLHPGRHGAVSVDDGRGEAGEEGNSDEERSKLMDSFAMRDEPDDERAEEDNARIDDILNEADNS